MRENIVPIESPTLAGWLPVVEDCLAIGRAVLGEVHLATAISRDGTVLERKIFDLSSQVQVQRVAVGATSICPIFTPISELAAGSSEIVALLSLLERYTEQRSLRWSAEDQAFAAYHQDWQQSFRHRWPAISGSEMSIGAGWADLLGAFLVMVQEHGDTISFVQIKEKFGELRLYHGGTDYTFDLEQAACTLSLFICEECGRPGKLRTGGWLRTLCNAHAG